MSTSQLKVGRGGEKAGRCLWQYGHALSILIADLAQIANGNSRTFIDPLGNGLIKCFKKES